MNEQVRAQMFSVIDFASTIVLLGFMTMGLRKVLSGMESSVEYPSKAEYELVRRTSRGSLVSITKVGRRARIEVTNHEDMLDISRLLNAAKIKWEMKKPTHLHPRRKPLQQPVWIVEFDFDDLEKIFLGGPSLLEEHTSSGQNPHNPETRLKKIDDVFIIKSGLTAEERLLRAIFGGERPEPALVDETMCECGKYRGPKYTGIKCDRCGTEVKTRRILILPIGWTIEEGKKWYQEYSKEYEYKPGFGYVRKPSPLAIACYNNLATHGWALHYEVLTRMLQSRHPELEATEQKVLSVLNRYPELFSKQDIGVYWLMGKREGRTYSTM